MNHAITVKDVLMVAGLGLIAVVVIGAAVWALVAYNSMRRD